MRPAGVKGLLPPACAWIAGAALLCCAAAAAGVNPLHAAAWGRYDSRLYEQIARHGYEMHRCTPARWCGTTAWFPAYPLLLAPFAALGIPLAPVGLAISFAAALATLVLLRRWFLPHGAGPLACAAFAPGLVYLYAIFPLSLLTLAVVVFLRFAGRDDRVAGAAGFLAALAYPLGLALVPVVAVVDVLQRRRRGPWRRLLLLVGPAVAAGIGILVAQRLQTGRWSAYFDVAGSYGGLHDPVTTITDWVTVLWNSSNPIGYAQVPIWQFLFVTVLLAVLLVLAVRRRSRDDVLLLTWSVGVWFVPLIQTGQSLWRSEAALAAGVPLVRLLPRRVAWAVAAALVVLAFGAAHEFFAGTLI
ncbi:MAG: hypothetical protein ABUS54_03795 [Actinomycetota bacterium]